MRCIDCSAAKYETILDPEQALPVELARMVVANGQVPRAEAMLLGFDIQEDESSKFENLASDTDFSNASGDDCFLKSDGKNELYGELRHPAEEPTWCFVLVDSLVLPYRVGDELNLRRELSFP